MVATALSPVKRTRPLTSSAARATMKRVSAVSTSRKTPRDGRRYSTTTDSRTDRGKDAVHLIEVIQARVSR